MPGTRVLLLAVAVLAGSGSALGIASGTASRPSGGFAGGPSSE